MAQKHGHRSAFLAIASVAAVGDALVPVVGAALSADVAVVVAVAGVGGIVGCEWGEQEIG